MAEFQELIPGLPDDVALDCLTRSHNSVHLAASGVCSRWRHLFKSSDFHLNRKQNGLTQFYACLVQDFSDSSESKPTNSSDFGISVFDSVTRSWERVDSDPVYPDGFPLFCQVASSEGKLVLLGGLDRNSYEFNTRVFIYDFSTRKWKKGKDMPSKRSFFATGGLDGRIYVAGGHDTDKNGLNSAWVYNLSENEWTELTRMSEYRDECHGLVTGSEFWVISGYETENQGQFKTSAEVYDVRTSQWNRVNDAWVASGSPRSCAGKGKSKREIINWTESNSDVRVGTCVVELGDQVLVSGSPSHGASREFFLGKRLKNGEFGEFEKLSEVPDPFSGFVQSGCCVEV